MAFTGLVIGSVYCSSEWSVKLAMLYFENTTLLVRDVHSRLHTYIHFAVKMSLVSLTVKLK